MRVVIIGAGAAGLATARHVTAAGIECEILEMGPELGGVWVYTNDVNQDQYGFPVYSAMYKNLRTNLPKEVMNFPDFPLVEKDKSYITQPRVLKYLNDYADHFNLRQLIKFNRMVTRVWPSDGAWKIKSVDKPTRHEIVCTSDVVIVCNGHHNEPNTKELPGEEDFKGIIMHSRQFRTPEPFANQKVLVIGAGPSGFDLVRHIATVAESVVLSHHNEKATNSKFASNVSKKPDILRIKNGEEVEFVDKSCGRFDTIVHCTGYNYSFPFLHEDCGISIENNFIQPLYKHMINIYKPTLCFIGIPSYVCAFQTCDLQARFYCKYLTGAMSLPSTAEMIRDTDKEMNERWAKGYSKRKAHYMGPDQQSYYDDLASIANTATVIPAITKLWHECEDKFYSDFQNFREYRYKIVDNENFITIN